MQNVLESIFSTSNFGTVQKVTNLNSNACLVTSSTGEYVLKKKTNFDRVKPERTVLEYLHINNVPAHSMLAQYQDANGQVYCLYSYLEGDTSIVASPSTHAEKIGQAIGELHSVLKTMEESAFPVKNIYNATFSNVLNLLKTSDNPKITWVATHLEELREEMYVLAQLPKQLIHRDAHSDNLVFHEGHFKGFIDFDLLEVNIRLFDPCYSSMGILPDRFHENGFEREWIQFLRGILIGYNRITPLTSEETRSIWLVIFAIEALFVALFITSSPKVAEKNAELCLWLIERRHDVEQLGTELA